MQISLLDYKLERCSKFAQKLVEFKDALNTLDLEAKLNDLHVSFSLLLNSFEIKPVPNLPKNELTREEKDGNNGIQRVKIHSIVVSVYDGLVIDVDDLHAELARFFVNRQLEDAVEQINMLWDYESRPCDFCGQYFTKPAFETPTIRIKMQDFTLAFHEACVPES